MKRIIYLIVFLISIQIVLGFKGNITVAGETGLSSNTSFYLSEMPGSNHSNFFYKIIYYCGDGVCDQGENSCIKDCVPSLIPKVMNMGNVVAILSKKKIFYDQDKMLFWIVIILIIYATCEHNKEERKYRWENKKRKQAEKIRQREEDEENRKVYK